MNLLQYCLCSTSWLPGFLASRHVGTQLPDQGSNLHPLHWKAKSQSLDHQGSPSLLVLNTLKSGICGRHLSRKHTGYPMYLAIKKNIGFFPWGGRKYRKEDHCNKTVIQYESKGVTEEMRKQTVLSNCSTESDAHPPPGT